MTKTSNSTSSQNGLGILNYFVNSCSNDTAMLCSTAMPQAEAASAKRSIGTQVLLLRINRSPAKNIFINFMIQNIFFLFYTPDF